MTFLVEGIDLRAKCFRREYSNQRLAEAALYGLQCGSLFRCHTRIDLEEILRKPCNHTFRGGAPYDPRYSRDPVESRQEKLADALRGMEGV